MAKAKELTEKLWKKSDQYLTYYLSLDRDKFLTVERDCQLHMFYIMQNLISVADSIDDKLANTYSSRLYALLEQYTSKGGRLPQR